MNDLDTRRRIREWSGGSRSTSFQLDGRASSRKIRARLRSLLVLGSRRIAVQWSCFATTTTPSEARYGEACRRRARNG
ncbi:hypothetical protein AB1484_35185 [Parafrankia sp. FMc6]|uniref:hypothetical protein n=1 Tax=Parafrankia soli TaxID=2599596 RepID=UPI0034D47FCE